MTVFPQVTWRSGYESPASHTPPTYETYSRPSKSHRCVSAGQRQVPASSCICSERSNCSVRYKHGRCERTCPTCPCQRAHRIPSRGRCAHDVRDVRWRILGTSATSPTSPTPHPNQDGTRARVHGTRPYHTTSPIPTHSTHHALITPTRHTRQCRHVRDVGHGRGAHRTLACWCINQVNGSSTQQFRCARIDRPMSTCGGQDEDVGAQKSVEYPPYGGVGVRSHLPM